jgi:hypothetical protein
MFKAPEHLKIFAAQSSSFILCNNNGLEFCCGVDLLLGEQMWVENYVERAGTKAKLRIGF